MFCLLQCHFASPANADRMLAIIFMIVGCSVRASCRYSWTVDCCFVIYINIHLSFHKANVVHCVHFLRVQK